MAPTPFSFPLAYLLVLSTKTVDDKGVKELISKWQKRGEREESVIILSDRCYQSLEQQQEQRVCSEGDFHCFKTLVHKGKETSEETPSQFWMGIQTLFGRFSCLWPSFFEAFPFLKKSFFLLSLKFVTMSGATSDQLHRSTLSVYLVSLYCLLVLYTLVSVPGVDKLWCTVYLNMARLDWLWWVSVRFQI